MRFLSVVHDYGRRLNQSSFRRRAEVSFSRARQFSEYNGKERVLARTFTAKIYREKTRFQMNISCRLASSDDIMQ